VVLVVLGCAIQEIQMDRIQTAIAYAKSLPPKTKIFWFLTGGVKQGFHKNAERTSTSEAFQMKQNLMLEENVILDENATNSAENFANLKKWLFSTFTNIPKVVITTSEFHKKRASKLFNGIFQSNPLVDVEWNLGKKACHYCWSDEEVHIKNTDMDIIRALLLVEF
jgi:hypothetical protein